MVVDFGCAWACDASVVAASSGGDGVGGDGDFDCGDVAFCCAVFVCAGSVFGACGGSAVVWYGAVGCWCVDGGGGVGGCRAVGIC